MATYDKEHRFQTILLNAALGDYSAKGFSLTEPDDHIVELHYQGVLVGRFLQARATISVLRETCQGYLEERNERNGQNERNRVQAS